MAQADVAIAGAARAVRAMMRAVHDAGGLGSALHERLGSALAYLTAPVRARAAAEAWEAYHAVVAGDLPNVDWPAVGGTSAEQIKQAREELAGALAPLAIAVGGACEDMRCQWREAAQREVARRDERTANRPWLRLCMRAWREASDGLPAGAAAFDQRWERGEDCALAQRARISAEALRKWGEVEWLAARRVLTWQRLVRAGAVHRKRRRNPTWRAKREEEHRRAWYSCLPHAQGHESRARDEQVARWQRGRAQQQHAQQAAREQRGGGAALQQGRGARSSEGGDQQLHVRHDVCGACDGGEESAAAPGSTVTSAAAGSGDSGAHADVPARHAGGGSSSSSSDRASDATDSDACNGGPSGSAQVTSRRTRRTDHTLALTTPARALLRCHLGGGETRLEHARRPRGDG